MKNNNNNKGIDLPYDPAIPLMGIYPMEIKIGYQKKKKEKKRKERKLSIEEVMFLNCGVGEDS